MLYSLVKWATLIGSITYNIVYIDINTIINVIM